MNVSIETRKADTDVVVMDIVGELSAGEAGLMFRGVFQRCTWSARWRQGGRRRQRVQREGTKQTKTHGGRKRRCDRSRRRLKAGDPVAHRSFVRLRSSRLRGEPRSPRSSRFSHLQMFEATELVILDPARRVQRGSAKAQIVTSSSGAFHHFPFSARHNSPSRRRGGVVVRDGAACLHRRLARC